MNRTRSENRHSVPVAAAALFVLAMVPLQSQAQSQCAAAMDTGTSPDTTVQPLQFTGYPGFAEIIRVTLTPMAGSNSADWTLDHVDYGLACADNQDAVPCVNGNDTGASSGAVPVEYVGNVDGTCGVTDSNVITDPDDPDSSGPGTVRFNLPTPLTFLAGEGCTISFDVRVRDIGTDNSPLALSGAAEATGSCAGGDLVGTGRGSVDILLEDAPPPPPPSPVPGPQGWWLIMMAALITLPAALRIARATA